MNKALLDTDILSEILKGIDANVARNATAYRQTFGRYSLSAVTVMEVVRGFQRKLRTDRLQAFLSSLASEEVFSFDQGTAVLAGQIAGDLERVGTTNRNGRHHDCGHRHRAWPGTRDRQHVGF